MFPMSYRGLGIDGNLTWHEFQDLRGLLQRVGEYTRLGSKAMTLLTRARSFLVARYWAVFYLAGLYIMGGGAWHIRRIS